MLKVNASPDEVAALKQSIRADAHARRNALADKDAASAAILEKFAAMPEYREAGTVMCYVHARSEVRTKEFLPRALAEGKRVVVPYCVNDVLDLFVLESMDELAIGHFKILEPKAELRTVAGRRPEPREIDLVMVPGVAFDRRGGRMGHGKGYYDKLLQHARGDTPLVALAYECQLFDEVPMAEHDIFMDKVVTEKQVYEGWGRKPR